MQGIKQLQNVWKKIPLAMLGIVMVMAAMLLLLWNNVTNSWQANPAILPDIYFEGEYKIADGQWNPVVKGRHISSTRGDVTLRGRFHMILPDGEYLGLAEEGVCLALYTNHIN